MSSLDVLRIDVNYIIRLRICLIQFRISFKAGLNICTLNICQHQRVIESTKQNTSSQFIRQCFDLVPWHFLLLNNMRYIVVIESIQTRCVYSEVEFAQTQPRGWRLAPRVESRCEQVWTGSSRVVGGINVLWSRKNGHHLANGICIYLYVINILLCICAKV